LKEAAISKYPGIAGDRMECWMSPIRAFNKDSFQVICPDGLFLVSQRLKIPPGQRLRR
jgi:hypothetical protein